MSTPRLLAAWIGHADLRAMAAALPDDQGQKVLAALSAPARPEQGGPIRALLAAESFDAVHLLSNYGREMDDLFRRWLRGQFRGLAVHVHPVPLASPTDYNEIYEAVEAQLEGLMSRPGPMPQLAIHLSPGTPAMAAVWLLLGKTRFPATFYQTHQGRAEKTDIRLDLAVVRGLLREPDARLQHLLARGPHEVTGFDRIKGNSPALRLAVGRAMRAALRDVPVLLLGETGTGKELFAEAIHRASPRRNGPFRAINCAAIPAELLESMLFGQKKGAFTGATTEAGLFHAADGGTLFLDEIGECPLPIQAKLLRALQPLPGQGPCRREFYRVGDQAEPQHADVRVLAATNRDLLAGVGQGGFREDLYHRLAVITVKLPPLRERRGDIPLLVRALLDEVNQEFRGGDPEYRDRRLSADALAFAERYAWPGNVRELRNVLIQAAVMAEGEVLQRADLEGAISEVPGQRSDSALMEQALGGDFSIDRLLDDIHRHFLRRAMTEARGVKAEAARLLGVANYQTLDARLKRLGVEAPGRS